MIMKSLQINELKVEIMPFFLKVHKYLITTSYYACIIKLTHSQ